MRESKQKSRTFRRIKVTTPGGRQVTHYEKPRHKKPACASCGKTLVGVARGSDTRLTHSQKRPERPNAGVLCSSCSRRSIIKQKRDA